MELPGSQVLNLHVKGALFFCFLHLCFNHHSLPWLHSVHLQTLPDIRWLFCGWVWGRDGRSYTWYCRNGTNLIWQDWDKSSYVGLSYSNPDFFVRGVLLKCTPKAVLTWKENAMYCSSPSSMPPSCVCVCVCLLVVEDWRSSICQVISSGLLDSWPFHQDPQGRRSSINE